MTNLHTSFPGRARCQHCPSQGHWSSQASQTPLNRWSYQAHPCGLCQTSFTGIFQPQGAHLGSLRPLLVPGPGALTALAGYTWNDSLSMGAMTTPSLIGAAPPPPAELSCMPCVLHEAKASSRGRESCQEFYHPTRGHLANLKPGLRCVSLLFLFLNWMLWYSLQTPFASQPSTHWKVEGKVLLSSKGPQNKRFQFCLETLLLLTLFLLHKTCTNP